jgi:hypothetical protein
MVRRELRGDSAMRVKNILRATIGTHFSAQGRIRVLEFSPHRPRVFAVARSLWIFRGVKTGCV